MLNPDIRARLISELRREYVAFTKFSERQSVRIGGNTLQGFAIKRATAKLMQVISTQISFRKTKGNNSIKSARSS